MRRLGVMVAIILSAASPIPGARAQTAPPLNYVQPLSPASVVAVQQRLKQAGGYAGRTDGIWGRESATALERYQRNNGLQPTGSLNQATIATMGLNPGELLAVAPAGMGSPAAVAASDQLGPEVIRTIQGRLRQLGFYSGQIDGIWGPNMQSSIERFQQGRALQPTGQLNPTTVTALGLDPNNLAAPPVVAPVR